MKSMHVIMMLLVISIKKLNSEINLIFIVQTSASFNILNNPSFFNLLYKLERKYVPPDRKTIRERIVEGYKSRY